MKTRAGHPVLPLKGQIGIYLILQPIRRTATDVTIGTGELLPHLLTLDPAWPGRLFSSPLLCPCEHLPFRKYGALCCPDFPPPPIKMRKSDRTICCFNILMLYTVAVNNIAKLTIILQIINLFQSYKCGTESVFFKRCILVRKIRIHGFYGLSYLIFQLAVSKTVYKNNFFQVRIDSLIHRTVEPF